METLQEETTTTNFSELLEEMYEPAFYQVAQIISKYNGTFEDAKDIFHDALIIYYNQVINGKKINSDINYLTGIAKYIWLKKVKGEVKKVYLEELGSDPIVIEEATINQKRLLLFLEGTGKRCMKILSSFYMENLNITYLSIKHGFRSEHSASVQKYKCIQKIREAIKSKSIVYEDFFE